jgi:GAF domain-containing protein
MVTGRPPFLALQVSEVMQQHLRTAPPRPSEVAPGLELGELEDLILQLLQKDPAARPQTAAEVLTRLERLGGDELLSAEERARLAALRRYRVLDTDPEPALDDLVSLASYICGTPIASITLVDEDRQLFKASVGLADQQTARNISFCTHTIRNGGALVVSDATQDHRFADNPLVTSNPHIRFYAGVPIRTPEGHALGSVCAIDRRPRTLNAEQLAALEAVGRLVQGQLELRRTLLELQDRQDRSVAAQVDFG